MNIPKDFKVSSNVVLTGRIPPTMKKAMDMLNALPFKLLLNSREVSQRLGVCFGSFQSSSASYMGGYRVKVATQFLYGSKKTIAELLKRQKEQVDAEEN